MATDDDQNHPAAPTARGGPGEHPGPPGAGMETTDFPVRVPVRVVVALGDPEREAEFLTTLAGAGDIEVSERALAADQLLACVRARRADVVLAASDLHRLDDDTLQGLAQSGVPVVLLAATAGAERWRALVARVLPVGIDIESARQALLTAAGAANRRARQLRRREPREHGGRQRTARASGALGPGGAGEAGDLPRDAAGAAGAPGAAAAGVVPANALHGAPGPAAGQRLASAHPHDPASVTAAPGRATVIVVASGHGAPGRTTVALNLATALGAVAPTVLIDADMSGPTVAAYVDGDPTRNLAMVAHAEPATARDWARAIEQELQPLGERSRGGAVLCGLPRAEMRAAISAPFAERLIAELAGHHRYVVVDVAAELLGPEAVVHRTVLALADEVFLVAAADLAGLWHAREALRRFGAQVGVPAERVRLVINRYDRRFHHTRTEIEWALGLPAAAVISHDQAGVQRAIAAQRPVVLDERSRAGRALLDLAERLHGGRVLLPPEEREQHRGERLRRWMAQRMRPVFRPLRTQMRVRVLAAALPGLVRRAQSTRVMRPVPGPDTPATGTALAPEAAAGTARGRAAGEAAEVAGLADSVGVAEVAGAAGHTVRRHTREEEMT